MAISDSYVSLPEGKRPHRTCLELLLEGCGWFFFSWFHLEIKAKLYCLLNYVFFDWYLAFLGCKHWNIWGLGFSYWLQSG